MAKTNYRLREFNRENASSGALVCMVKSIYDGDYIDTTNNAFKGVGICKSAGNNILFICKSVSYMFSSSGTAYSTNSQGFKLMMAELADNISEYGSTAVGTLKIVTTRSATGDVSTEVTEDLPSNISIEDLNVRDKFAALALRGILAHVENPTLLSDNEISMYCDAAYQWAANMMSASAKVREVFDDESASDEDPNSEEIGILETTQEKLLNNIIVSMQRTSKLVTIDEQETYVNQVDVVNLLDFNLKLDETNLYIEALKDNITDAMTNLQSVETQMVGCLNNIVSQLALINTSIQSFTSNMNTRMNTINSNISSARNEISDINDDLNTVNGSVNNIKSTVNTVNSNVNTIKSDVGIIKQNTTP